jgi:hypothetical protein
MEHRLLNVTAKSTSEGPFNLMTWLLLSTMSKGKMYAKNLVFSMLVSGIDAPIKAQSK